MPTKSLNDLIADILERGEPIDYESLLAWPKPANDLAGFQLARSALYAYNEAQSIFDRENGVLSREEVNAIMAECAEPDTDYEQITPEEVEQKLDALTREIETERERRKNDPIWKQFERKPVPKIPFLDDKPEVDQTLTPQDWRIVAEHLARFQSTLDISLSIPQGVDWRPGIRPERFFDDASEFHYVNYPAKLLCLTAIRHALHLRQEDWDKYLTSAARIGFGASSIRLLMSHLVVCASVQRILDTIRYILHHVTASPATLKRLASTMASLDDENLLAQIYVGERVFGLAQYRARLPENERNGDWWNRLNPQNAAEAQIYLSDMALLIDTARLPLCERYSSWLVIMDEVNKRPAVEDSNATTDGFAMPALLNDCTMLTQLRLMRFALTALSSEDNTIESQIAELQDPFDPEGKPLRYRKTADGFIVYSVGLDQIDGGGSTEVLDDFEPFRSFLPRRRLRKDFALNVTPRQDGQVSFTWSC